MCHTDMYTASGADPSGYAPTVLGHEGAGVVERVGSGVTSVEPGRPGGDAVLSPVSGSASTAGIRAPTCVWRFATSRIAAFCPMGPRACREAETICHFMGTRRTSAQRTPSRRPASRVVPEAEPDRACLFACGLSTGLGAAMNTAQVKPGSTCVVFGAGMVGLGAVAGCRLKRKRSGSSASISPRSAWSLPGVRAPPRPGSAAKGPWSGCSRRRAALAPTTRLRPPGWSR